MNVWFDAVRFTAASSGTGDFVVNTAVQGYRTPATAGVPNSSTAAYRAESSDLSEWEEGIWTYASGTTTCVRTTVTANHLGTTAKVNFTAPPQVALTLSSADIADGRFPSGTAMLFQQTSAPTGWTKSTTHNDKALRVVNGTASSGGTNSFSTVMAQTAVGNTTLSTAQMPSHSHTPSPSSGFLNENGSGSLASNQSPQYQSVSLTIGNTGGGGSHNHSIVMSMQYVDIIIATKD